MHRLVIASFAAAGLSVGLVATVAAADLSRPAPPVYTKAPLPVPFSWTGFYIGANAGGAWDSISFLDNSAGGGSVVSHSSSGFIGGGQVGARYQIGQFVFGVEGTWDWTSLKSTVKTGPFPNEVETFKVKDLYTGTGQLGWAWDRFLVYGKGGFAASSVDLNLTAPGAFTTVSSPVSHANGWTAGVGLDYAAWQNWVLGIEYDHSDLSVDSGTSPVSNGGGSYVENGGHLKIDQVVGRASYKFGPP